MLGRALRGGRDNRPALPAHFRPLPARPSTPCTVKQHFLLDPSITFLNHGSYGAVPRPVLAAWQGWQAEAERNPVAFLGRRSAALLAQARQALGAAVGAPADDLAFIHNATSGVNVVARSLALAPGDEVLTTDLEYGACLATWARVCERQGAVLRVVAVPLPLSVEGFGAALAEAMTPRTRVLFLSHITSPTALVLPIEPLLRQARARGVITVVDGAHAPGQVALNVQALDADFYAGNGHKWLCGPKGTGFLYVRPEHQGRLRAAVTSWGDVAEPSDQPTGAATPWDGFIGRGLLERRMNWQGTRDLSGFLALPAAVQFQAEHDWPTHRARCHAQAVALLARVAARTGIEPIAAPEHLGQMAPLPVPHQDAAALKARLFDEFKIEVPVTQHITAKTQRSFVRVSVQAYNDETDVQRLDEALRVMGM
jgi:isopenicillin-N epimerase